jgi:hypothetical protein
MARQEVWVNEDGLAVGFGTLDSKNPNLATVETTGNVEIATMVLDYDTLPAAATTAPSTKSFEIREGSVITRAYLRVTEEFTSAGATTLAIGFKEADGTAIDADGLFEAIAKANLDAGDVVEGDGDLIGAIMPENGFISTVTATGPWTAGSAVLTIEYVLPTPDSQAQDPIDGIVGSL